MSQSMSFPKYIDIDIDIDRYILPTKILSFSGFWVLPQTLPFIINWLKYELYKLGTNMYLSGNQCLVHVIWSQWER